MDPVTAILDEARKQGPQAFLLALEQLSGKLLGATVPALPARSLAEPVRCHGEST